MKRAFSSFILTFFVSLLIFTGGKVYAYSNWYVNSNYIDAPFIDIYMSWDDAVFNATYSYTFTDTNKFTTQQTQLIYQGTDSDPIASNIGDYISDIEVISHNYKLNGATLTTYVTENETSFSGISAVASVTYSPFIVVATSNDELGCKFEVTGQGYNWFNGEVENNRDVDFS